MQIPRSHTSDPTSSLTLTTKFLGAFCILLALFVPTEAPGQETCYAVGEGSFGAWTESAVWAEKPSSEGGSGGNCPTAEGYPAAQDTAVIEDTVRISLLNTNFTSGGEGPLGKLKLKGGTVDASQGAVLTTDNKDIVVTDSVIVNAKGSGNGLQMASTDGNASMVVKGFFTGEGRTEFTAGDSLVIESNLRSSFTGSILMDGGKLKMKGSAIGGQAGTIQMQGGTLELQGDGFTTSTNAGDILLGSGGVFDMDASFTNNDGATLDINDGTLRVADVTFKNAGNFTVTANADSDTPDGGTVIFDKAGTARLEKGSSSGGFAGGNGFENVVVKDTSTVDPADGLTGSNAVSIDGNLTIEDNSGGGASPAGQWGTSDELAEVKYGGFDFVVVNNDQGEPGEFFSPVTFNNTNSSSAAGERVEAAGRVFSQFKITNTAFVEITSQFTVNGKTDIADGTLALNGGELVVNGDFENNGTYKTNGNRTIFSGRTNTSADDPSLTSCSGVTTSDGDCEQDVRSAGTLDFGPVILDGTDTRVNFGDDVDIDGGGVLVDEGADDSNVQFQLDPNEIVNLSVTGDVTVNGSFRSGGGIMTLDGGSPQNITTSPSLTLETLHLDNGSDVELVDARVTVTDSLSVTAGKAVVGSGDTLRIGGPARLNSGNGETSLENVNGNDGQITLLSDNSKGFEGSVEYVDGGDGTLNGTISGTLTYERELDAGAAWYFLTTPVSTDTTDNETFGGFLEGNSILLAGDQTNDIETKGPDGADNSNFTNSTIDLYKEPDVGANEPSWKGWKTIDCAGFDSYSGCSSGMGDPMKSGRGYKVYVAKEDVGTPATNGFPKTIYSQLEPRTNTSFQFSQSDGSASDGPGIDVSDDDGDGVDSEEGWNLFGNPYLSPLDYCSSAVTRGSNLNSTVFVWDPLSDGYASWNCSTETGGGNDPGVDGAVNLEDGIIAPHQAFFVKGEAESSGLELTVNNIVDAQADTSEVFLKRTTEKPPAVALTFEIEEQKYRTSVGFVEGASTQKDNADGYYLGGSDGNSGPSLYSFLPNGTSVNINAMPRTLETKQTLPLKVDACDKGTELSGPATIHRSTFRNIPADWDVALKDTTTGDIVDLSTTEEYTFEISGTCPSKAKAGTEEARSGPAMSTVQKPRAKSGHVDTRFELIVDPTTLPVEFAGIEAETDDQDIVLNWTTASEQNNAGFRVQRKTEDGSFTSVGEDAFVESQSDGGTSDQPLEYSYRIDNLEPGTHTLRLKQVNTDGSASFSDPVEAKVGVEGTELTTYPNPAETQATVKFGTETSADVTVALYNTLGQKVQTIYRGTLSGDELKKRPVDVRALGSGLYFVRMKGDGVNATQRMTVVK